MTVEPVDPSAPAGVLNRAVLATGLSFTISDATAPDLPLLWVNPAFTHITGYAFADAVGRNCRFMQGPDTDPGAVRALGDAVRHGGTVVQTVLNYRADGTPFWNEVSLSPVLDGDGRLTHYVGTQADVTARVTLEEQRAETYRRERSARELAEAARARTALIVDVGHAVTRVDARAALPAVTDLVAAGWCGWAAVYLTSGPGLACAAFSGGDPRPGLLGHRIALARLPAAAQPSLVTGRSVLVSADDLPPAWRIGADDGLVVAPLRVIDQTLGVLLMASPRTDDAGHHGYLQVADAVATRVALALDISRLYDREREVAEKLQQALLPHLPSVDGLDLVAHYAPSTDATSVCGDWYEVLPLPDGRVLVAIGDVEGHDLEAVTTMGRLRSSLLSYALELHGPAALLGWLEQALAAMAAPRLASVCVGLLQRPTAASDGRFRWAAAGHLPALLRRADGTVEVLDAAQGPLLGARIGDRREAETTFAPGDTLLLYTDGLIEDRRRPLREGLALLAAHLGAADVDTLGALGAALAGASSPGVEDDTTFLAVRARALT